VLWKCYASLLLCRAESIIKARCSNSRTFRDADKHRLLVDLRQAVLSSTPATFALLRDIKRKRSSNSSWYEDRYVCPCVPHCVSVMDICQARRYLGKSTTTKGHIYLRAPDSGDAANAIAYQCRAVVVRCPEQELYSYSMTSEANRLVAHVRNRHEQMPSSRTDHNCPARSYGLCANDAFAWCAALRHRTKSHVCCFMMAVPIDALSATARQLVWQLEEVKSAEAHHERAHSRPRPGSASSKQSICKSDLTATFKTIIEEAQAQLIKLVELETHKVEEHELQEHEAETQEQRTRKRETCAGLLSAI
jgi:hypothetical protein